MNMPIATHPLDFDTIPLAELTAWKRALDAALAAAEAAGGG